MTDKPYLDAPPESAALTDYDRKQFTLYMRLLDADAEGAHWREVVSVLFDIDPDADPQRARQVHDSHLARARWMTTTGYRLLLREPYH